MILFLYRPIHSLDPDGTHRKSLVSGHICDNISIIGNSIYKIIIDKAQRFDFLSFFRCQLQSFLCFQTHHRNLRSLIGAFRNHPRYVRLALGNDKTVLRNSILNYLAASVTECHLVQRAIQIQIHLFIGAYIRQNIQILAQHLIRNCRWNKQLFLRHLAFRVKVIPRHPFLPHVFHGSYSRKPQK